MTISSAFAADIEVARAILNPVFPIPRFHATEFLEWLYFANPVGRGIYINSENAGHYGCIPQSYHYQGRKVTMGLSLNVAVVSRKARGQGMFRELIAGVIERGRTAGFSHIIGVANANSTPGFLKRGGFRLVAPLPVRLGFFPLWNPFAGALKEISADAITLHGSATSRNEQDWAVGTIRWRLQQPGSHYRVFVHERATIVAMTTTIKSVRTGIILKVWAQEPLSGIQTFRMLNALGHHLKTPFLLHAGCNRHFSLPGVNLPLAIRPTPLNLIVKTLDAHYGSEADFHLDTFEFLDFDAY